MKAKALNGFGKELIGYHRVYKWQNSHDRHCIESSCWSDEDNTIDPTTLKYQVGEEWLTTQDLEIGMQLWGTMLRMKEQQ
jgi:hypothetical protein